MATQVLPVSFQPRAPIYSGGTAVIGDCTINLGEIVSIPYRWKVEIPEINFSQEVSWAPYPCSKPFQLYAVIPLTEKISNATVKVTVFAPEGGPYTDWTTTYTTDILPGYDPTQTLLDLSVVNVEATVNITSRTGTFKMTVKAVNKTNVYFGFDVTVPLSGYYYSFSYSYTRQTSVFTGVTELLGYLMLAPGENIIIIEAELKDVLGIGEVWFPEGKPPPPYWPTPPPPPGTRIPQGGTLTVAVRTISLAVGGEIIQKVSIPVEYEFLVVEEAPPPPPPPKPSPLLAVLALALALAGVTAISLYLWKRKRK